MYLFTAVFLLFLLLLFFFCTVYCRRKKVIKKVCSMPSKEKWKTLDELLSPFGYSYIPAQDIISSRTDAWQRDFGYTSLFDKAASYTGMIIDCLPVYFNYQGRTWLIEFWKGQYGINTGCEIGVYYAERILKKEEYTHALFQCADNDNMQKLGFTLSKDAKAIAELNAEHWWLTTFLPGVFSAPSDLYMHICVTLKSREMAEAFVNGLISTGYRSKEICLCRSIVTFTFANRIPAYDTGVFQKCKIRLVQFFNRMGCRLFLSVTKPFRLRMDRILYLYYFMPSAFHRIFRVKKIPQMRHSS